MSRDGRLRWQLAIHVALLAAFLISGPVWAGERLSVRVVAVVDGDTWEVLMNGKRFPVRLYGIDCPEWGQPGGAEARRFAADLVEGRTVTLLTRDRDAYGRMVAEVSLQDGRSAGRQLLRAGHAWWYRRYNSDPELERLETTARLARRGLWREADPTPPWIWRRQHPRR